MCKGGENNLEYYRGDDFFENQNNVKTNLKSKI